MGERTGVLDRLRAASDPTEWPLELCPSCMSMTRTTPTGTCGKCGADK